LHLLRRNLHGHRLKAGVAIRLLECGARLLDIVGRTARPKKRIDGLLDALAWQMARAFDAVFVDENRRRARRRVRRTARPERPENRHGKKTTARPGRRRLGVMLEDKWTRARRATAGPPSWTGPQRALTMTL
jgi:hypothetical protein